ncbi:MAG TPA: polysaccharide deacetylase family protein [Baekduia sp.]|nr:polysaccharide deacetylase family protein [Baekduia sp.]
MRRAVAVAVGALLLAAGCARGAHEPAATTAAAAHQPAVPILLYHHLATPPRGDPHGSLWVTPARFTAHVAALYRAGFHAVTLAAVWRAWHGGAALPSRPVVITFDDGFGDQDTVARPVLARHGWPGVLNLQVNHLDTRGGLSRAAVARMVRAGWEVDDHTTTHPDLTHVSAARLKAEVSGSRAALRRALGIDPMFFCYPYGRVDARVRRAVKAAGFAAATTIEPGRATASDDPLMLPRIIVRGTTTPAVLVTLARG